MTFRITFGQACGAWVCVFALSHEDAPAQLSTAVRGPSLAAGLCRPRGHRAALGRPSSGLFPTRANASDCTKHGRAERPIQMVCVKPDLRDSRGRARLCGEQILRGIAPSSPPRSSPWSSPRLCTSAHSLHHGPWQGLGRWQQGPALLSQPPLSPFVTACPWWVSY